ncbi:hypothetical protein Trydic_g20075 [Trypoxylus dichotomus]
MARETRHRKRKVFARNERERASACAEVEEQLDEDWEDIQGGALKMIRICSLPYIGLILFFPLDSLYISDNYKQIPLHMLL